MYASADRARAADVEGLAGHDDSTVLAALGEAADLVDRFTGRFFGQQTRALVLQVSASGRVDLPVEPSTDEPLSIVSVAVAGESMPTTLWAYDPPLPGGQASLSIGSNGRGSNMLIAGAEPWNGGFDGLASRYLRRASRMTVTGTFGSALVPASVQTASAMIAVMVLGGKPVTGQSGQRLTNMEGVKSLSQEGFSVTFESAVPVTVGRALRTTGVPAADRLLAPYVVASSGVTIH